MRIANEFIRNNVWRAIQVFGKQGIFFFIFTMAASVLTKEDFGIYNYIYAISAALILFCDFGISKAVARRVALSRITKTELPETVVFNMSVLVASVATLIIFVTLLIILFKPSPYLIFSLPLLLFVPLASVQEALYLGLEKFKKLATLTLTVGLISLILSYPLVHFLGIAGLLISQSIFHILIIVLLIFDYKKFDFTWNKDLIIDVGKYAVYIGVSGAGFYLFSRVDILALGSAGYYSEISYYEIINVLLSLITAPVLIISSVLAPRIAVMWANSERKKIGYIYKKTLLIAAAFSTAVVASLNLFFKPIIGFLYPVYDVNQLHLIFQVVSIIFFSHILTGIVSAGFSISTGHARLNMIFLLGFGMLIAPAAFISAHFYGFYALLYVTVFIKLIADISYLFVYSKIVLCNR
jgi:teichuronic acid exporter